LKLNGKVKALPKVRNEKEDGKKKVLFFHISFVVYTYTHLSSFARSQIFEIGEEKDGNRDRTET